MSDEQKLKDALSQVSLYSLLDDEALRGEILENLKKLGYPKIEDAIKDIEKNKELFPDLAETKEGKKEQ